MTYEERRKRREERQDDGTISRYEAFRLRRKAKDAENVASSINERLQTWFKNNNVFMQNHTDRYRGRTGTYNDSYASDASKWLETITNQKNNFDLEAKNIISLMDEYSDFLDPDYVKNAKEYLTSAQGYQDDILKASSADVDYWSQWKDENAYKEWVDVQKQNEEWAAVNIEGERGWYDRDMQNLAQAKDWQDKLDYDRWLRTRYPNDYHNLPNTLTDADIRNANAQILRLTLGKGIDEFEKYLSEKNVYLTQAERYQNSVKLSSVTTAPDFEYYAGKGLDAAENEIKNAKLRVASGGRIGTDKELVLTHITDKEKKTYAYYLAKNDEDSAEKYIESLVGTVNERLAGKRIEGVGDSAILSLILKAEAGLAQWGAGLNGAWDMLTGNDAYVPPSALQIAASSDKVNQNLGEVDLKWFDFSEGKWKDQDIFGKSLGQVAGDITQTTANQLPSIMMSFVPVVGQGLSLASMGISASGNAYTEMINAGYSKEQARSYGLLVGGSEVLLGSLLDGTTKAGGALVQKLGGKSFESFVNGIDKTFARVAISTGSRMLGEFTEESLQSVLEPWFESVVTKTDYEAANWEEVLYSGLLGALSAGALGNVDISNPNTIAGATANAINKYKSNVAVGKQISGVDGAVNRLVELGSVQSADSVAYKVAEKINKRLADGKKVGAYTIAKLFNAEKAALTEANVADITRSLIEKGVAEADAKTISAWMAKAVEGVPLTEAQANALENNPLLDKTFQDVIINPNSTVYQRTKQMSDFVSDVNRGEMTQNKATTATPATDTTKAVNTTESATAEEDATESKFKASDESVSSDDAITTIKEVAKSDEYKSSPSVATMVQAYESGQDASRFASEYDRVFNYAYSGTMSLNRVINNGNFSTLTQDQIKAAYNAGAKAAKTKAQGRDNEIKSLATGKTGRKKGVVKGDGVSISDLRSTFNDTQNVAYKVLSRIAEVTGIDIVLYKSEMNEKGEFVGAQGKYDRAKDPGTLYIDINAGLKGISDVGRLTRYTMLRTFSHEFSHFIENFNPIWYNELRSAVFEQLSEYGEDVDGLIQTKMEQSGLDYDRASREVVAQALTDVLDDSSFVNNLAEKHKNVFNKLLEKLKEFLADIKAYFSSIETNNAKEAKAMKKQIGDAMHYVESIVELFDKAAVGAVENYQQTVAVDEALDEVVAEDSTSLNTETTANGEFDADGNPIYETERRTTEPTDFDLLDHVRMESDKKYGLTKEQSSALDAYVSGLAYLANKKVLEGTASDRDIAIIQNMIEAIKKFPVYEGRTYRNVMFKTEQDYNSFLKEHLQDTVVDLKAITSSSKRPNGYPLFGKYVVHMVIDGVSGRDIADTYGIPKQQEVLFLPGTQYKVNSVSVANDGHPIIYAKEIANNEVQVGNGDNGGRKSGFGRGNGNGGTVSQGERNDNERVLLSHGRGMETSGESGGSEIYNADAQSEAQGNQVEVKTELSTEEVEQEYKKKFAPWFKKAYKKYAFRIEGGVYLSDGALAVKASEQVLNFARLELPGQIYETALPEATANTVKSADMLIKDAPTEAKLGNKAVYAFDIDGKKMLFDKKLFSFIDGGILYYGKFNSKGGIIKSVNEDGSLNGFLLSMAYNDKTVLTDEKPSKLKSFSKNMLALIAEKQAPKVKDTITSAKEETKVETKAEAAVKTKDTKAPKATKVTKATEAPKTVETTVKLEDFGEKIGGARKDEWGKRGLLSSDLTEMNDRERDKAVKKDNVWKRPDYRKLIEGGEKREILFARNEIRKSLNQNLTYSRAATPERKLELQKVFVDTVREIQSMAEKATTIEDFKAMGYEWLLKNGYLEVTNGYRNGYSYTDKWRKNPALHLSNYVQTIEGLVRTFDKLDKLADQANFAVDAESKIPAGYTIHEDERDHTWFIAKGRYVVHHGLSSYDEALTLLKNAARAVKTKTRFVPRQLTGVHRKGPDYRGGKDVKGQDYLDTFGFKGGEFGNWLSEKDRRVSMNYGFDALKDLADALGVADTDISLNGNLSIAFGARGQGLSGASAHYERERHVINLTKMNGAGSLAHEWFHALDDFAGGYGNNMATDNLRTLPERTQAAMRTLLSTMQYRDATQEETDMAATKRYEQAKRSVEYQVKTQFGWVEKFESGKLTDADTRYFARKPTEADVKRYHELFDKLLSTGDASVVDELSTLRKEVNGHVISKENRESIGYRLWALKPSETEKVQKMRLRSDYYNNSRLFGELHQKDGDYWDSTVEMAARAFACYIADKTNAQNDYLSAHSDSAVTFTADKSGNPVIVKAFPEGQERIDINRAFDDLISAMKEDGILHERGEIVKPDTVQYQSRKYIEDEKPKRNKKRSRYNETETLFMIWANGSAPIGEIKRFYRFGKIHFYEKTESGCVELSQAQYDERSRYNGENIDRRAEREIGKTADLDGSTQKGQIDNSISDRNAGGIANIPKQALGEELRNDTRGSVSGSRRSDNGDAITESLESNRVQEQSRAYLDESDTEYMEAVNRGDTETAQRMVDEAAKAWGATTNGNVRVPKPLHLYHGTGSFGFTRFRDGSIYATASESVAAGYNRGRGLGRVRSSSLKYVPNDGTVETAIKNAKNVLGATLTKLDDNARQNIMSKASKILGDIANKVSELDEVTDYGKASEFFEYLTKKYGEDKAVKWTNDLDSLHYMLASEYTVEEILEDGDWLVHDLARYHEWKQSLSELWSEEQEAIKNATLDKVFRYLLGYEYGDALIDIEYGLGRLIDDRQKLVNENGSLVYLEDIIDSVEMVKDTGIYDLYGHPGEKPLIIDEGKRFWDAIPFENGFRSTDYIVKWAKEHGYTSVLFKTVLDPSSGGSANVYADEWVFFNPNQVKSADPITYDDDGNIIPLSERFKGDNEDIRYQDRSDTLTDTEILEMATAEIDASELTEGERSAFDIWQKHLTNLRELEDQRAELGTLYKEQNFTKGADRKEAAKTLERMKILDGKLKAESDKLFEIEQKSVLQSILKKARKVVERKERAHGQELLKRYRERRENAAAIKKYRDRIKADVSELSKWILHPDNKNSLKHVPDVLKNTVIDFLTSVDFTSQKQLAGKGVTKADEAFAQRMKALRSAMKNDLDVGGIYSGYNDLPDDFMETLDKFIEITEKLAKSAGTDFVINKMSADELRSLSKIVKNLKKFVTMFNSFHSNAIYQHVSDAGDNSIEFMQGITPATNANKTTNFLFWQQMRPAYAFERFGEGGKAIYDGLRRGQAKLAFNTKKIVDFAEKTYTAKEVKEWEKAEQVIKLPSGGTIRMKVSQIMGFYELSKQPDSLRHILEGGVRVANYKDGKTIISDRGRVLTYADIAYIVQALTPRQKEVADAMQKFMAEQGGKWGNYVTMARFGEEQFTNSQYYPISSDGRLLDVKADEKPDGAALYALLNLSFTKSRNENADNRIVVYSIFDVFSNHMASMAQYNALALPVLDAVKWLNYKQVEVNEAGNKMVLGRVREEMSVAYGAPEEKGKNANGYAVSFVINVIKAFNGTAAQGTPYDSLGLKALRNYNRAQIAYNVRVVAQQPMAITRAAMLLDYKSIIKGMKLSPSAIKANIEEMREHSGIATWKALGFYDINISRGVTSLIKQEETWLDKTIEFGMKGAEVADTLTWQAIWSACKEQVERKQKLKPNDKGYFDAVTALFEDVIYKTQVVDSVLTKSEFMRDKGYWASAMGSFMSEPTTTGSMILDVYYKFRLDMRSGKSFKDAWSKNGRAIGRLTVVYSTSAILLAAAQGVIDAYRDDDEYEEWYEKWLEAFRGNLVDELMPFNKIPFAADFYDLVKELLSIFGVDTYGNPPQSVYMQWTDSLVKAAEIFYDKIMGEDKNYTWYAFAYKMLQTASGISGLPISSVTRTVVNAWNNTVGAMAPSLKVKDYDAGPPADIEYAFKDGYLSEEEATKLLLEQGLAEDENEAYYLIQEWNDEDGKYSKYDALKDALASGEGVDDAMNELITHGKTEKEVISQVKSIIGTMVKEEGYSEDEAIRLLTEYADLDNDEARKKVDYWAFVRDNPKGYDRLNEASYAKYKEMCEPYGVSIDAYYKAYTFRNDTNNDEELTAAQKKRKIKDYIYKMDIPTDHKRRLIACWFK